MKKGKKIFLVIIIIILVLVGLVWGGKIALIKYLSANDKVNEIVDKAAEIVANEETQQKIDNVVAEMVEEGTLDASQLDMYMQYNETSQIQQTTPPTKEPIKTKGKTRTERILNAMSPADAAFARSMMGKLNISYAMQLMNSDMSAAKRYIKSCLTSGEISKSLGIYSKYAYLLKEIK